MKVPTNILRKMGVGAACVSMSLTAAGADSPAPPPVHPGLGPTSKAAAPEDPKGTPSPAPRPADEQETSGLWLLWITHPQLTLAQVRDLELTLARKEQIQAQVLNNPKINPLIMQGECLGCGRG